MWRINLRHCVMGTSSKSLYAVLSAVASSQGGYFTSKQAVAAGYVDSVHGYHVRNGDWIKVYRGIYRLADVPEPAWADLIIWTLWSRDRDDVPQGVFAGETALAIHGLIEPDRGRMHMIVPKSFRRNSEIPELLDLRKDDLNEADIEKRDGFMVTTLRRTIRDIQAFCTNPKILDIVSGTSWSSPGNGDEERPECSRNAVVPVVWGDRWDESWAGDMQLLPAQGVRSYNDIINAGED